MARFIINRKTNYLYKKSILKIQDAFYFHFILSSQTIYKNQILLYNCFYYNYYFIICPASGRNRPQAERERVESTPCP